MKKLRALGSKPKGHPFPVVSWLLRFIEWTDISHAVVDLGDGRIFHAHFNSVGFEDKDKWAESNEAVYKFQVEIPEENYNAMLEWMEGYKGQKSGYFKKLFGAFIPRIVKLFFNKTVRNTFVKGMEDNAICTELVRFCALRFWNYTVPTHPYAENFTTQDFVQMMENNK